VQVLAWERRPEQVAQRAQARLQAQMQRAQGQRAQARLQAKELRAQVQALLALRRVRQTVHSPTESRLQRSAGNPNVDPNPTTQSWLA
jgi:hypothetical protein